MAGFVVEDGSGKSDATSYCSVADADTYHTEHDDPVAWSGATDAVKEGALMEATTWLDSEFKWKGRIANATQALGWPRSGASDNEDREEEADVVPQKVIDATAWMALQHIGTPLDQSYARGGDIKRQKVGPLEVEFMDTARPGTWRPYVRRILNGLFTNVAGSVELVRA